jgi:excinuclease ABC subunit C
LKGHDKDLLRELKKKMQEASDALAFEKAEELLQTIRQIEHVTTVQHVDNPFAKDCDVIGLFREADAVLLALLLFREGKIIASEHFSFHRIFSEDDELLESFILQHYKNLSAWPREIFVPIVLPQSKALEEILSEAAGRKMAISTPKIGKKKDLLEMAHRNAKALFVREQDARSLREKRLLDLQETLQLTRFPRRIECFDTSNISGTDPVASLVSFVNGEKEPARKKLFKIKGGKADDYSAMREVLYRHYLREKEKNDFCDLLILDGGKGQLNIALEVFKELGIASIDAIGVSKEEARHDKGLTREKVYLPYRKDPLLLDPRSPLLFLLQSIRDEAHRAALAYHRKRRSKRTLSSELDTLEGIGEIKKKRLLARFGSVKAIQNADEKQLREVKGLTKKDLETLGKLGRKNSAL